MLHATVKKRLRNLAAALLLLAMPLQAFAAASMLFCGRVMHDKWLGQTFEVLSKRDVGRLATVVNEDERGDHARLLVHPHDDGHKQTQHLADSCSSCTDCCCPTVLASALPASPPLVASQGLPIPFIFHAPPDFIRDRLERPPSSTLG